ncbi:hypothetical protein PoB_007592900 [Plakobranchus ocellatus]|uniref:Uncharacterized protein n=1 Tax=Plakobranchus ocellatus TaxID=259542 RepID=A0AAV4DZC4_9GAST|nr:hypothetical protein PoB_007592900 [Plakobranchus ocellatus]
MRVASLGHGGEDKHPQHSYRFNMTAEAQLELSSPVREHTQTRSEKQKQHRFALSRHLLVVKSQIASRRRLGTLRPSVALLHRRVHATSSTMFWDARHSHTRMYHFTLSISHHGSFALTPRYGFYPVGREKVVHGDKPSAFLYVNMFDSSKTWPIKMATGSYRTGSSPRTKLHTQCSTALDLELSVQTCFVTDSIPHLFLSWKLYVCLFIGR